MSDRIVLTGLRLRGRHGVLDAERADGQLFIVDADLELDTAVAARSDELADTVDYSILADQLAEVVTGEPVNLVETLAERLVEVCLSDSRVSAATVTVHKPQAPMEHDFADVAVKIRRERQREQRPKFRRLSSANLTPVPDEPGDVQRFGFVPGDEAA